MRISDWSSDVCSSDLALVIDMPDVARVQPSVHEHALGLGLVAPITLHHQFAAHEYLAIVGDAHFGVHQRRADGVHLDPRARAVATDHRPCLGLAIALKQRQPDRSEEHTSELQSLMRISYAVFCLKKKNH